MSLKISGNLIPKTDDLTQSQPNPIKVELHYNDRIFQVEMKPSEFNIKMIEKFVKSNLKLKNDFYVIYFIDFHECQIIIKKM